MNNNYIRVPHRYIFVPKEIIADPDLKLLEVFCALYLLDCEYQPTWMTIRTVVRMAKGRMMPTLPKQSVVQYGEQITRLAELGYIELFDFDGQSYTKEFSYRFIPEKTQDNDYRYSKITTEEYSAVMAFREKSNEYHVSATLALRAMLQLFMYISVGTTQEADKCRQGGMFYVTSLATVLGYTQATMSHALKLLKDCGVLHLEGGKFNASTYYKEKTVYVAAKRVSDAEKEARKIRRAYSFYEQKKQSKEACAEKKLTRREMEEAGKAPMDFVDDDEIYRVFNNRVIFAGYASETRTEPKQLQR